MYGLDIGTATIVLAEQDGSNVRFSLQRDVFFTLMLNKFNINIYKKQMDATGVNYLIDGNTMVIIGNHALELASSHNSEIRRPMANGILNPKEQDNIGILGAILKSILGESDASEGHPTVCHSVPADPYKSQYDVVFHESVCKDLIEKLGYKAVPVNEAMAVVYAELEENDFTGIGISFGGGMVNVCISQLATPLAQFAYPMGGDWIDAGIARSLNVSVAEACLLKETEGDLNDDSTREKKAIVSYYKNFITNVVEKGISDYLYNNRIRLREPIPVVLSGGTASIIGFKETFEDVWNNTNMHGIEVSKFILPKDPIKTVARGLLTASLI